MQDPSATAKWGLVATLKAEAPAILDFCAWHLEQGAHRLFLYLDAPCPEVLPHLKAHPKIRVIETDAAHWQKRRGRVPQKHQVRQSLNATRAYRRQAGDLDWLIHVDVDEFLWSQTPIHSHLGALPPDVLCARVRPLESLAGGQDVFKARIPQSPEQDTVAARLYPQFGPYLRGGFISHVQGKLFVRTGLDDVDLRIHNVYVDAQENPAATELADVDLCHLHATDWTHWLQHYRYRLQKGSYRSELRPSGARAAAGVTLHQLLSQIESDRGEAGLRAFFDEICADSPELRAKLDAEGLLRRRDLPLTQLRRKHFTRFS
ncbi:glycosyltransferase family 2 protein [Tritonibacter sp. SIMBA_163]|uniref:glycosyltransferase family 2 protein n=1 Tax=Tritonibacter sp. SIMBA_163 TaxID=3080868 RepID=UPI003980484F